MTSDTMSRNATARIMPNESSRERISASHPLCCLRAGARQMRSSAFCSSPNTALAPAIRPSVPVSMAIAPAPGRLALASNASMARAPSGPTRPEIWPNSSPRAASSPNTRPAIASTIRMSGAIENSV